MIVRPYLRALWVSKEALLRLIRQSWIMVSHFTLSPRGRTGRLQRNKRMLGKTIENSKAFRSQWWTLEIAYLSAISRAKARDGGGLEAEY